MQRSAKKSETKVAHAAPQEQLPHITISVRELVTESHKYTVYPQFQRDQTWSLREQQQFIDSLLLGDSFPPAEGYEVFNGQGEKSWGIIDGQNRLSTIISYVNGEFKTWTAGQKRAMEPSSNVGPVQPGKFFDQLDPIARNYLLDYRIRIDKVRNRSLEELVTRFLRLQHHVPLTAAEKLNAYPSKAKDAARRIEQHSFWEDFYEGRTNRKQIFQSSLYLLALQLAPDGIQDLQATGFVYRLASGKYDETITDDLVDTVLNRLDKVSHVYAGTHFTIRAAIVAMYQSVMFLEQAGYTLEQKDKGRLTDWISTLISASNRGPDKPNYNRSVQRLTSGKAQGEFWTRQRAVVLSRFGLVAKLPPQLEGMEVMQV